LFSAVLSAFLIEIRKGLQEDVLLQILRKMDTLSSSSTPAVPFHPTTALVSVNWIWFLSLSSSMMGALGVILAKAFGRRWVKDQDLIKHIQHMIAEERDQYYYTDRWAKAVSIEAFNQNQALGTEMKHSRGHTMFAERFWLLIRIITALIYLAFMLFFFGLVILLLIDSKSMGIGVLIFNVIIGTLFALFVLDNLVSTYLPLKGLLCKSQPHFESQVPAV
jgi:hypothetical protein